MLFQSLLYYSSSYLISIYFFFHLDFSYIIQTILKLILFHFNFFFEFDFWFIIIWNLMGQD